MGGDRVVFGAGVKINPHILLPDDEGKLILRAAAVRIGADALVGGYSLLLAGCWIGAGELSPGRREMRPFTGWVNGRRVDSDRDAFHNRDHDADHNTDHDAGAGDA